MSFQIWQGSRTLHSLHSALLLHMLVFMESCPVCRKLIAIGQSDAPAFLKNLQRLPVIERFAAELLQLFIGKAVSCGADGVDSSAPILSY